MFALSAQAQEVKEIWSEIKKEINNTQSINNVGTSSNTDQIEGIKIKLSDENIVDQNLDNSNILLAGLFDPDDNDQT